jgi:benzoylformate decarboxylase
VWSDQPARAQDVPGAIVRAYHEAETGRGPAIVIVPMDDWLEPAPEPHEVFGPQRVLRSAAADPAAVDALTELLAEAGSPAIVSGAGADWAALTALAERLACPVFQEPFGGQAGFPQDHPLFAGHLPARRARLREVLAPHDVVLVVGTGALRQYPYDPGPLVRAGARLAVITQDPRRRIAARSSSPCSAIRPRSAPRWRRRSMLAGRRTRPDCGAPHRLPRPPPASRCAPATCSPRWPSGCRATRSSSRRRRRAAPSCTPACPPPSRSAS